MDWDGRGENLSVPRLAPMREGLGDLSLLIENHAEIMVRAGISRIDFQGPLKLYARFCEFSLLRQRAGQVVVEHGVVWLKLRGLAVMCDRLVQLPLLPQGSPQVVMGLGQRGPELNRPAKTGCRRIPMTLRRIVGCSIGSWQARSSISRSTNAT